MSGVSRLRVVLVKPSKYNHDGWVERFRRGAMPNCTLPYMSSLTPREVRGAPIEVHAIDEYVHTDLDYLDLFTPAPGGRTLVGLVGVQSHQLHRALDLAALARKRGALAVMGGPHPMTCDTTELQNRGVAFALSEADRIWEAILGDALDGELRPVYGGDSRWVTALDPPVVMPPAERDLRRYSSRLFGVYPARGCPYICSFCSIIKIAGHQVRSQPVETTLATLRAAKRAGAGAILFTSDNFNKYAEAPALLQAMIDERIELPFLVQCDLQVYRQPEFIRLLGRAGCVQMYLGVESFDRATLRSVGKNQNQPDRYTDVRRMCHESGISTMFANILGFPGDTAESILDHLARLRSFGSDLAQFYILTPLPGTTQYDEFLRDDLIVERNLDRFDAASLTFRHPTLSADDLTRLVYRCYREFYAVPDVLRKGWAALRRAQPFTRRGVAFTVVGYSLMQRVAAMGLKSGRREPTLDFAGGLGRARVDHVSTYLPLRRETYGFELAPLPKSLKLSAHDEGVNRAARLRVVGA